jgi:phospholipid/cholesterol/gamma-HCH transport system substrate-binding protein
VIRRLVLYALTLVAVTALAVSLTAAAPGKKMYEFDAIFDNGDFLIEGQDVKIGGAQVGQVKKISLAKRRYARITLEVEERFGPFRENASCSIRPQGLIGEKFVQCEPGTPEHRELAKHGGSRPTIPVERTHAPVDLDLVFGALRRPIRERLTILLNELGTGLAGRPQELNDAIRRANPALKEARETLSILSSERRTLGRLIDESDRVIDELAQRRNSVRDFISNANDVTRTMADRRGDIDLAIRRLPPLLAELEPSARELAGLAQEARPPVRELAAAAPSLRELLAHFDPLAEAARPTLAKLSELSRTGRRAVRSAHPVADRLRPVADRLPANVDLVRELTDSIGKQDVAELLGRYVYFSAAASSRFDKYSHILPSYQLTGTCAQYTEVPEAQCDAHFGGFKGDRGAPVVPQPRSKRAAAKPRSPQSAAQEQALDFLLGP